MFHILNSLFSLTNRRVRTLHPWLYHKPSQKHFYSDVCLTKQASLSALESCTSIEPSPAVTIQSSNECFILSGRLSILVALASPAVNRPLLPLVELQFLVKELASLQQTERTVSAPAHVN